MTTCICPVCRARNSLADTCRRCRADLSWLRACEEYRVYWLTAARCALADGDLDRAASSLRTAEQIRQAADTAKWRAVAALIQGNYAAAWNYYQEARNEGD